MIIEKKNILKISILNFEKFLKKNLKDNKKIRIYITKIMLSEKFIINLLLIIWNKNKKDDSNAPYKKNKIKIIPEDMILKLSFIFMSL